MSLHFEGECVDYCLDRILNNQSGIPTLREAIKMGAKEITIATGDSPISWETYLTLTTTSNEIINVEYWLRSDATISKITGGFAMLFSDQPVRPPTKIASAILNGRDLINLDELRNCVISLGSMGELDFEEYLNDPYALELQIRERSGNYHYERCINAMHCPESDNVSVRLSLSVTEKVTFRDKSASLRVYINYYDTAEQFIERFSRKQQVKSARKI